MNLIARRTLVWSAVAAVMLGVLAWLFWPQAIAVDMVSVTHGPMRVEVADEGRTRVREIYQLSAPVNGKLLRIAEHAGDVVVGGKTVAADLLPTAPAFLDVRSRAQAESAIKSAQAARSLAEAEVRRAKAELAFADSDLRRATGLAKENAISRANLERAQLAYNTAAAQLATSHAALQAKQFDLEAAKALLIGPGESLSEIRERSIPLVAPVSGRVLRVLHENEAVVSAGTPILEIGDPKTLEIVVELISEDAVKVREGAMARITDWGGEGALNARVRRVEPGGFTKISALGVEEQRVNVLLDFTDPPEKWPAIADGFRVIAHIVIWQRPDAIQIPLSALFRSGDGWAAFVVRNGRASLTHLRVGRSNDENSEILGGIEAGAEVIAHPSDRVTDGVRVEARAS